MESILNGYLWLLPLIAIVGIGLFVKTKWWSSIHKSNAKISSEYFKGLDFLIDQQHDKAADVFIKLIETGSDTIETQIVLGNLFRQKGEMEKAIWIHQSVTRISGLSRYYAARSLFELGRDYFSAGLLDRGEEFFKQALLSDTGLIKLEIYPHLLSLYEIEKNWWQAIKIAEKLKKNDDGYQDRISHYYCELAEQALDQGDHEEARKLLVKAEKAGKESLRVIVIKGDIDLKYGKTASAERQYVKAFEIHPQYAGFLLPKIRKTLMHLNAGDFSDHLKNLRPEVSSTKYLLDFCKSLLDANRHDELEAFFSSLIKHRCIPLPVVRLYLEHKVTSEVGDKRLVDDIISSLLVNEHSHYSYRCSKCGFEARHLYWQCPGCRSWDSACPEDVFKFPDHESTGRL